MYVQVGHKKNSSSHSTVIYPSGGAQKDWICDKHFFIPSSPGGNKHAHIKYMTAYSIPAWPAGHLGLHVAYVHFLSSSPYNGQILQKKTHLLICYVKICSSVFFLCFFCIFLPRSPGDSWGSWCFHIDFLWHLLLLKRARRNDVNDLPDFKSPPSWKGEKRRTPPDPTREPRVGATIAAAGFVYLFFTTS